MEIAEKDFKILEDLKGDKDFERIVWAYTGTKKASSFHDVDERERDALAKVGLEVSCGIISPVGWQKESARISEGKGGNYALGTLFSYPECCVSKYECEVERVGNEVLFEHPLRGCYGRDQLSRMADSFWHDGKEVDLFMEELNRNDKEHGFWKRLYSKKNNDEMKRLIDEGKLPKHMYLLGADCVPCEPDCQNMIEKMEEMYESLIAFGKDFADSVVEKYAKKKSCY